MNLSAIDLNLLQVLHTVLSTGSVRESAERLHLTPSAVSNALRRLRDLFDDPLFVREGRGLVPTPRALALRPALASAMETLERALEAPSFDPVTCARRFTVALSDGEQIAGLPELARRFTTALPRASLRVVSIDALIASGGLGASEIELAVGPATPGDGLISRYLYDERAVFAVRADHPRVADRLDRETFLAEGHVDVHLALGEGGEGHARAEGAFGGEGLARRVVITVPSFTAAARVAAHTDAIAGLPFGVASALAGPFGLRLVDGPMPELRMGMFLLWHPRVDRDPGAGAFRQLVHDALTVPRRTR